MLGPYFKNSGVSVNIPVPNLNSGTLSNVAPITVGAPMQFAGLGPWQIPTPQPYLANAIANVGQSIGSGLLERAKAAERKEERRIATEQKEEDRKLREQLAKDRIQATKDRASSRERVKGVSVTEEGRSDASELLDSLDGDDEVERLENDDAVAAGFELGEAKGPSQKRSGSLGEAPTVNNYKREASPSPVQGALNPEQAQRTQQTQEQQLVDAGPELTEADKNAKAEEDALVQQLLKQQEKQVISSGTSALAQVAPVTPQGAGPGALGAQKPVQKYQPLVIRALDALGITKPRAQAEAPEAPAAPPPVVKTPRELEAAKEQPIVVTPPKAVEAPAAALSDAPIVAPPKVVPVEGAQKTGVLGEPVLEMPDRYASYRGPIKYPTTFKDYGEYIRAKEALDKLPGAKYTLKEGASLYYDPKARIYRAKGNPLVLKSAEGETPKTAKEEALEIAERRAANTVVKQNQFISAYNKSVKPALDAGINSYTLATKREQEGSGGVGVSDNELIGFAAQIALGGKATAFEVASMKGTRAVPTRLMMAAEKVTKDKVLTTDERDAIFDIIVNNSNEKAESANKEIARLRAVYRGKPGISEAFLPQFVAGGNSAKFKVITKKNAVKEITGISERMLQIYNESQKITNKAKKAELEEEFKRLKEDQTILNERLLRSKYNGKPILEEDHPTDEDFEWLRRSAGLSADEHQTDAESRIQPGKTDGIGVNLNL